MRCHAQAFRRYQNTRGPAMRSKPAPLTLVLLLCISSSLGVSADEGVVTLQKGGCSYFVMKTGAGHALVEWDGHNQPIAGDVLSGEFKTGTMKMLQNVTAGAKTKVWIEDYPIAAQPAAAAYKEACR